MDILVRPLLAVAQHQTPALQLQFCYTDIFADRFPVMGRKELGLHPAWQAAQARRDHPVPTLGGEQVQVVLAQHPGVRNQDHPAYVKALPQGLQCRLERAHIGRAAWKQLIAYRQPLHTLEQGQNDLHLLRLTVFAESLLAKIIALVAGEEKRRYVEKEYIHPLLQESAHFMRDDRLQPRNPVVIDRVHHAVELVRVHFHAMVPGKLVAARALAGARRGQSHQHGLTKQARRHHFAGPEDLLKAQPIVQRPEDLVKAHSQTLGLRQLARIGYGQRLVALTAMAGPLHALGQVFYRKQGGLPLFQQPQLRPVRQPHQRLQERPFRGRAHMLDDPLPRSLAGYAGRFDNLYANVLSGLASDGTDEHAGRGMAASIAMS